MLADWNGAAITGLVRAATALSRPEWLDHASAALDFILEHMAPGGDLHHAWFDGRPTADGLATDYAWTIAASLALHAATGDAARLDRARQLHADAITKFYDPDAGALYLSPPDAGLILRPLSVTDDAMPAASGVFAAQSVALFHFTADSGYLEFAKEIIARRASSIGANIIGTASLQSAADQLHRARLAVIAPATGGAAAALRQVVFAEADPALVTISIDERADLPAAHPAHAKGSGDHGAALYLCGATACRPPVKSPQEARKLLAESRPGLTVT